MKYLFGRGAAGLLAEVARSRALLAFDFDGTLAPIVADRDAAFMTRSTAALLTRVAELYPCAVISGRGRADVARRLGGANVKHVVGNHGLEPGADLEAVGREMERARRSLERSLGGVPGVEIEDKTYSLSVHFRGAPSRQAALGEIDAAIARVEGGMRVIPGKLVVNVVPASAPNKADALLGLRSAEHADLALYFGDDVTDEDVFELDQPGRVLSVRVGMSRVSAARYFLRCQREIDEALAELANARAGGPT